MYNRYIPQSDGSFRRSQVSDGGSGKPGEASGQPPGRPGNPPPPPPMPECTPGVPGNVGGFLSGLLPQSFDTEDMIIILLLLLFGSSGRDQNGALLTLIIYLFL